MIYKVVIKSRIGSFPIKGLNELLNNQYWNARAKKFNNEVKASNDMMCRIAIIKAMRGVKIDAPIRCHFHIYAKDKKHDRGNIYTALEKSFLDALQHTKVIKNDTFDLVYDSTFITELDRENPRIEVVIEVLEVEKCQ